MNVNVGKVDRVIRLLMAITAVVLFYAGITSGVVGIVLIVVGAILGFTSLISFCPIYALLGINTCPTKR